jgi:outer membrane protein OmpA-like peptidoglycan-associated protein
MNAPRSRPLLSALLVVASLAGATSCRGWKTEKTPIHLNWNMDTQEKGKAYRHNDFFQDGRWMRPPPAGTVARGFLSTDDHFSKGTVDGKPAVAFPAAFPANAANMARGKERYGIYCSPCHGMSGNGKGTVAGKLKVAPPAFHDARLKEMSVGKIYEAMTLGVNNGNMPSYATQLTEEDRWNVVLYVRALQRSQDPSVAIEGSMDPDDDGDGVKSSVDNCPKEKGTVENAGCAAKQLVKIDADSIDIAESVYFKTGSAIIDPRSFNLLNNVAAVLTAHGEVKKLVIEGHTDDQGDAAKNLQLSKDRAKAVAVYLSGKGVDAARLTSDGFGSQKPIADNKTAEGREKNRRVAFTIGTIGK